MTDAAQYATSGLLFGPLCAVKLEGHTGPTTAMEVQSWWQDNPV
jgi:hypothetical protein